MSGQMSLGSRHPCYLSSGHPVPEKQDFLISSYFFNRTIIPQSWPGWGINVLPLPSASILTLSLETYPGCSAPGQQARRMGPRPGHNRGTNSDSENGKPTNVDWTQCRAPPSPLETRQQKFYGTHNPDLIPGHRDHLCPPAPDLVIGDNIKHPADKWWLLSGSGSIFQPGWDWKCPKSFKLFRENGQDSLVSSPAFYIKWI